MFGSFQRWTLDTCWYLDWLLFCQKLDIFCLKQTSIRARTSGYPRAAEAQKSYKVLICDVHQSTHQYSAVRAEHQQQNVLFQSWLNSRTTFLSVLKKGWIQVGPGLSLVLSMHSLPTLGYKCLINHVIVAGWMRKDLTVVTFCKQAAGTSALQRKMTSVLSCSCEHKQPPPEERNLIYWTFSWSFKKHHIILLVPFKSFCKKGMEQLVWMHCKNIFKK